MAEKKYVESKTYCNDGTAGEANRCCYHHDRGYSEPNGRTRAEIDRAFLDCMTRKGSRVKGWIMYLALRAGGWVRWNACREHDKTESRREKTPARDG